jgi:hypothetical protein
MNRPVIGHRIPEAYHRRANCFSRPTNLMGGCSGRPGGWLANGPFDACFFIPILAAPSSLVIDWIFVDLLE